MLTEIIILSILYFIFLWTTAWIRYFNNLDERLGDTIWRWSYDYPVKGKRDVSNLDDKNFVLLRRKRNRAVTIMYSIVFLSFIILMSFVSQIKQLKLLEVYLVSNQTAWRLLVNLRRLPPNQNTVG